MNKSFHEEGSGIYVPGCEFRSSAIVRSGSKAAASSLMCFGSLPFAKSSGPMLQCSTMMPCAVVRVANEEYR